MRNIEMVQCSQTEGSFYDFIYLDKLRINTALAQLSNDGVLSSLTKFTSETDIDNAELSLKLPITAKKESSNEFKKALEKSFDTSWALPIVLLNELSDKIKRNPKNPISGDLALISGDLLLLDIPTLKKNLPLLEFMIKQNHPKKKIDNNTELGLNMLKMLPSSIQLRVKDTHGNKYWMTLEEDNFTINIENLSLKYGSLLTDNWQILCYVDLIPTKDTNSLIKSYENYFDDEELAEGMHQLTLDVFTSNMEMIRRFAGCNDSEYAISPIMIFKKVNGNSQK